MDSRQPLPRIWMMTDERQGKGLFVSLERLPQGAGIVFRHYSLADKARRTLFEKIADKTRLKGMLLMLAGDPVQAEQWGADGVHGDFLQPAGNMLRSMSVHDLAELEKAERAGADLIFVSPVFATRSHPDAAPLTPEGFEQIARKASMPVIALGGMNARRAASLAALGAYGWAAIDFWSDGASA